MDIAGLVRLVERWGGVGPLLCAGLGGLLTGVALLWLAIHWFSAPGWATAEGRIVQAGVTSGSYTVSRANGRGTRQETRYRADISYRYTVGGRDYTGQGIGDGVDWNYWSYESAAAAVAPYNQAVVTVYYDPSDPGRSALDTSVFGIVPLILGGAGLPLLGLGLWLRRARRAKAGDIG